MRATALYLTIPLLSSAFIDLPARVELETISLMGAFTIVLALSSWLFWVASNPKTRPALRGIMPWLFFLGAVLASFGWFPPTGAGLQNAAVLTAFVGLLLFAKHAVSQSVVHAEQMWRVLSVSTGVAVIAYEVSLVASQWEAEPFIGPRGFAAFLLLGIAWFLAGWRCGSKKALLVAVILIGIIIQSTSRTAFGAALILVALAQVGSPGKSRWLRAALTASLALGLLVITVTYWAPMRSRFFLTNDMSPSLVTLQQLNMSGRDRMWDIVWHSFLESPLFGHGSGSSAELIEAALPGLGHPHNDYLRLLHDFGVLGASLFLLAFSRLLLDLWNGWRLSERSNPSLARGKLAAFLAGTGIALTMLADNPISYIYLMAPLGVLLGSSLTGPRLFTQRSSASAVRESRRTTLRPPTTLLLQDPMRKS